MTVGSGGGPSGSVVMEQAETSVTDDEATGISLELLDRLRPFMTESLMVLDHDWTVTANLAPPGGLIGRGLGLGVHTLEDMHPDDAVQVMELGVQAFSTGPGWQGSKLVRMRRGDGEYGRYEVTAINMFDDPVIAGMVVRTREVPEDVADDLPGLQTTSALETLAEMLPTGVVLIDPRGRIVFANDTACGMLGREPEELKREGLLMLVAEIDRDEITEVLGRMVTTGGREECTAQLVGARVERVQFRFSAEGQGEVASIVLTMDDVTERHAAECDLERRANHDDLTGLRNRASLLDLLHDRFDRDEPTTVAYVDLDGFKAVNDTWGHDRGDHLLVAVAEALRTGLPLEAEVARIGGDEFVVVTRTNSNSRTLPDLLHSIVDAVAATEGLTVSCSIGLAESGTEDSPRDALRRADESMYTAKARRR